MGHFSSIKLQLQSERAAIAKEKDKQDLARRREVAAGLEKTMAYLRTGIIPLLQQEVQDCEQSGHYAQYAENLHDDHLCLTLSFAPVEGEAARADMLDGSYVNIWHVEVRVAYDGKAEICVSGCGDPEKLHRQFDRIQEVSVEEVIAHLKEIYIAADIH